MNPFSNILAQTSGSINKCIIDSNVNNKENDSTNVKTKAPTTNRKAPRKSSIIPSTPSTIKKNKVNTANKVTILPKSALKSNAKRFNDGNNIVKIRRNLTPENEVLVLVARLKQLVGNFDDTVILEKLTASTNSSSGSAEIFRSPTRVAFDNIEKDVNVIISPNMSNFKSNSNSNDDNDEDNTLISYFMDTNAYDIDTDINVKYNNRVSEIAPIRSWQTRYSLCARRFSLPGRESLGSLTKGAAMWSPIPGIKASTSLSILTESENLQNANFSDFYIIGVDRGILTGQKPLLSLMSLQPPQILDSYPKKSLSTIVNIVDYCFPQGVKLDLVPASVAKTSSGPAFDQFHITQFCDSNGKVSYGCCLTITEHIDVPNDIILENLRGKLLHEAACNKIKNAYKHYKELMKRGIISRSRAPQLLSTPVKSESAPSKIMSMFSKSWSVRKAAPTTATKKSSWFGKSKTLSSDEGDEENGVGNLCERDLKEYMKCFDIDYESDNEADKNNDKISNIDTQSELSSLSAPGSPANEKTETKYAIITQRSFCVVSDKPNHSNLFKILAAIAHKERLIDNNSLMNDMISSSDISPGRNRAGSTISTQQEGRNRVGSTASLNSTSPLFVEGLLCDKILNSRTLRRHRFLNYMQTLSLDSQNSSSPYQSISFPSYIKSFKVDSQITTLQEWTCGILFCSIPADVIIQLLSYLLQEVSLIVYGVDQGLVTSISTALLFLLKPFAWEGIFVPLMPSNAREIMDAPVPFVVGTTQEPSTYGVSPTTAVLYIDSIINKKATNDRITIRPPQLYEADASYTDPSKSLLYRKLTSDINYLAYKLRSGSKENLTIRSATVQLISFLYGMNNDEKYLIKEIMSLISNYNTSMCGDLLQPAGWRNYGAVNASTGEFEFYPQWFMDPIQAQCKFQENIIHTQFFVSFMDKLRTEYNSKNSQRQFIGDWIYYTVHKYKSRKINKT